MKSLFLLGQVPLPLVRVAWGRGMVLPIVVLAALSGSPGTRAAEGDLPFSRLKLTIRTDQATYVLGQPIAIYAELSNPSDKPVTEHVAFEWARLGGTQWFGASPGFFVGVSGLGGKFFPYTPYKMSGGSGALLWNCEMRAGEKRVAKLLLVDADPKTDWLGGPGMPNLQACAHGSGVVEEKVLSAPVRVTLKWPAKADSDAYWWLARRRLLVYLGHMYWHPQNDLDIVVLKAFLEKYPETTYARYVQFGLGQMYFKYKRYDEAIRVFEEVVKRFPTCTIAEEANYLVGECYFQQNKAVEAARRFGQVLDRYPGTPVAQDAEERLTLLADMTEMLFPEDKRLDVKVDLDFLQPTPLAEVLKVLSVRSGVPLRASPELQDRTHRSAFPAQLPLRTYMSGLRLYITEQGRVQAGAWIREDDGGYRLVPVVRPDWEMHLKIPPEKPEPKRAKPPAGKPAIPGDAKAQPK